MFSQLLRECPIEIQEKSVSISFCKILKNKILMVPYKCTAEEVSFEWSNHRILSTSSKVRKKKKEKRVKEIVRNVRIERVYINNAVLIYTLNCFEENTV